MLVGQQLGPFKIEKELGAGAMGAVYKGKYTKTGQVVAVKVMAPGLGTGNPAALARFEREANILKQLRHGNIVRLFGIGRHHGTPYYAMEYVQGESLDRIMARRGRMSWEEVVDVGTQLCAALQHAHEAGIVHRDLKPSNLMVLPDGTVKLTDFGIAKDMDVTALTGANCTIGTAAYMSPEQCRGDPNIGPKSDLYSMGVVFYELITGKKPFQAESAMDMFLKHANGTFERPSRVVLDLPVWMDNLICQLLEKKTEHRPLDAATVGNTLASIQEKVEALHSAGVDAARARSGDRTRGQGGEATEEDRRAARTLQGKKGKKKKKAAQRWQVVVQAAGLLVLLAGVITGLVVALRPPSAESLYSKAERMIELVDKGRVDESAEKRERARERLDKAQEVTQQYLARYGTQDDKQTADMRLWANAYDAAFYEELLHKHIRYKHGKARMDPEPRGESQKLAFKAVESEDDGDAVEPLKLWEEIFKREGNTGLGFVAQRHLLALKHIDVTVERLEKLHMAAEETGKEPGLDKYEKLAFQALRQEKSNDLEGAQESYAKLRELATGKDADDRFWQVYDSVRKLNVEEERGWQLYAAVRGKLLKDAKAKKPTEK